MFFCGLFCYTVMFAFLAYESTQLCGDVLFCVDFLCSILYEFLSMVCTLNVLTISLTTGFKVFCFTVTIGH